ncbi:hypothetical protein Q5530_10250 [Saccharothrix sp. BKS2]|uniref:hypothetical protein n=1 Tax=Saccharothrix sp. BKS2 TaxID=3064400 RepID=UPI0039EBAA9B
MSADFPEPDGRVDPGLADWLAGFDVPEQRGGPAYPANFGWTPPRVPLRPVPSPRSGRPSAGPVFPLVPLPRRAPDDLV